MIIEDLDYEKDINNNWRTRVWALFENNNNYSSIFFESLLNKSISLESIERQESKTTK